MYAPLNFFKVVQFDAYYYINFLQFLNNILILLTCELSGCNFKRKIYYELMK